MSNLVGIRPNLKAYCCSWQCTGKADHEIRPHFYKLVENVSIHTMFCPTCSYALLWSDDVKNERKRTLSFIPESKTNTTSFKNVGR